MLRNRAAQRPGRRGSAARRQARSQANGVRARRLREVKRKLRNQHTREGADAGRCVATAGLQSLGPKSAAPATHGSTKSHSPDTVLGETNHWPKRVSLQSL